MMVAGVDFARAGVIVEFGPGTGVFTDLLLARRRAGCVVLVIERNEAFCTMLREKFAGAADFYVIHGSADQVGAYLTERGLPGADYIVSGLPFASLPRELSEAILTQARASLVAGGRFITFQYTLLRKDLIMRYFSTVKITREIRNLPPAYVLTCGVS